VIGVPPSLVRQPLGTALVESPGAALDTVIPESLGLQELLDGLSVHDQPPIGLPLEGRQDHTSLVLESNGRTTATTGLDLLAAAGALLVGFSGSWLGGCLFWGWFRLHPLWHLPIEAFALPLAVAGLKGRWRLAASFYLASLLGTACTDGVMAITGVMGHWREVLLAPIDQAAPLLHQAALGVLEPLPLAIVGLAACGLIGLCRHYWHHPDPAWRLAASALATTLCVDGLFLAAALAAPRLSGLI
jgi:hypothetical protein